MGLSENTNIQTLPDNFTMEYLDRANTREIHQFLNQNYIEDSSYGMKHYFELDYIYWYFKNISKGMAVGLRYKTKLVGMIVGRDEEIIVNRKIMKNYFIEYFCIHKKLRKLSLGKELKQRMSDLIVLQSVEKSEPFTLMFTLNSQMPQLPENANLKKIIYNNFAIPINYQKLQDIGMMDCENYSKIDFTKNTLNPPVLINPSMIPSIVVKLNKFLEPFRIKSYITEEYASHYFISKKRITYSFCWFNEDKSIKSFINYSESKNALVTDDLTTNTTITTATINYYFYDKTHNLTEMIEDTIPYLLEYGVDHLIINDMGMNNKINIPKFPIAVSSHTYLYANNIDEVFSDDLFIPINV